MTGPVASSSPIRSWQGVLRFRRTARHLWTTCRFFRRNPMRHPNPLPRRAASLCNPSPSPKSLLLLLCRRREKRILLFFLSNHSVSHRMHVDPTECGEEMQRESVCVSGTHFSEILAHVRLPEAHDARWVEPSCFGGRAGCDAESLYIRYICQRQVVCELNCISCWNSRKTGMGYMAGFD